MRVMLVQFDIRWEDPEANFARVAGMVRESAPVPGDLIVLPEMFDTGFSLRTDRTRDTGRAVAFLQELADTWNIVVHGSRTVLDDGQDKATNRACVVFPKGGPPPLEYSKIHPFSFGREPEAFVGGDEIVTYDWNSGGQHLRVCPAVCYDLRFPELFRIGLVRGAEAFALGANWPDARQAHWRALLIARAIENQAFVFGVNRVGSDPHLRYSGGSIVVGPKGDILAEAGSDECVLCATVDPDHVRFWRDTFPAWKDLRLREIR